LLFVVAFAFWLSSFREAGGPAFVVAFAVALPFLAVIPEERALSEVE
jgi:hypothetical protein